MPWPAGNRRPLAVAPRASSRVRKSRCLPCLSATVAWRQERVLALSPALLPDTTKPGRASFPSAGRRKKFTPGPSKAYRPNDDECMRHPQVRPDPALGLLKLYDDALPHVYGYLLARCGDTGLAEDLTAESFLAAVHAVR